MILRYTKKGATAPRYATDGAACFDLAAQDAVVLEAGSTTMIDTGISVEVPKGFAMLLFSRSGHANRGIRLANCVGVIDSDYRGSVGVMLTNDGTVDLKVLTGDRIAQAMIVPVMTVELEESRSLSVTARGAGGFGSTGA